MEYSDKVMIESNLTINKTILYSDIIGVSRDNESIVIEIHIQGSKGDSDNIEVYQVNSIDSVTFETIENATKIEEITLDSDTEIIKFIKVVTISKYFKIGLKMNKESRETCNCNLYYQWS